MVNPPEAGFILRGNVRLPDPILSGSDPVSEAEQRLLETSTALSIQEVGLGVMGPPGLTP
jgi:hypothetical protein